MILRKTFILVYIYIFIYNIVVFSLLFAVLYTFIIPPWPFKSRSLTLKRQWRLTLPNFFSPCSPPGPCEPEAVNKNLLADLHACQNQQPSAGPTAPFSPAPPTSESLQTALTLCQKVTPTAKPDTQGTSRPFNRIRTFKVGRGESL